MEPDHEPHEIAADLSRKPHRILMAIRNRGGEAKTSAITEDTGLDGSTVNYHYGNLRRANLIEKTSEDAPGGTIPREGYSYQITDRGREVLSAAQEDYGMDPVDEGMVRRRLDEMDGRLSAVEEELQDGGVRDGPGDLEERVDGLRDDLDGLTRDVEKVVDVVRDLEATVQNLADE